MNDIIVRQHEFVELIAVNFQLCSKTRGIGCLGSSRRLQASGRMRAHAEERHGVKVTVCIVAACHLHDTSAVAAGARRQEIVFG
jgi:hypothetical protein